MASIVTGILSSTVGLLLNKARDKTADKLKDRDITDAKIREIIVRELNDVKAKIDGLSRKDLLTSYNFLQEGVNLLKACLDESEKKPKAVLSEIQGDGGETSAKPSDVESGILIRALTLSQAMRKVKINADKEFEIAKKRFEDARKEATRAFCNEALSTKDRIFAAKLRVVSELLECLECPDSAIINCLLFLETLHSLPTIRQIFSVYINGGVRSMVSKAERVENVKSVMLINYVLFQYAMGFSSKYRSAINWPTIEIADRSFRPIWDWQEVSTRKSWGEEFVQPPNEVILDKQIRPVVSALNSHGEIIVPAGPEYKNINVTSRTGEVKMVKLSYPGDNENPWRFIAGLAVDSNNNIYVLTNHEIRRKDGAVEGHGLYVFNENYNVKQKGTLNFLEKTFYIMHVAINKNNNIIILCNDDDHHVYVCDNAGELKHKFKPDTSLLCRLTISDKNEILLASSDRKAVDKYTEKGDLELTMKLPEGHVIHSVAFNHVICKIMVVTYIWESYSYFLLCYSETGELESSTFLRKGYEFEPPYIGSHPSGPVVAVSERSLTFI